MNEKKVPSQDAVEAVLKIIGHSCKGCPFASGCIEKGDCDYVIEARTILSTLAKMGYKSPSPPASTQETVKSVCEYLDRNCEACHDDVIDTCPMPVACAQRIRRAASIISTLSGMGYVQKADPTYAEWKLKLITLISDAKLGKNSSFLKLQEINCVLSDDCDYPQLFKDGDTPEDVWQGELDAMADSQ